MSFLSKLRSFVKKSITLAPIVRPRTIKKAVSRFRTMPIKRIDTKKAASLLRTAIKTGRVLATKISKTPVVGRVLRSGVGFARRHPVLAATTIGFYAYKKLKSRQAGKKLSAKPKETKSQLNKTLLGAAAGSGIIAYALKKKHEEKRQQAEQKGISPTQVSTGARIVEEATKKGKLKELAASVLSNKKLIAGGLAAAGLTWLIKEKVLDKEEKAEKKRRKRKKKVKRKVKRKVTRRKRKKTVQQLMKEAAKKWRKMSERTKAKYEGGFKDYVKVYIESHYRGKKKTHVQKKSSKKKKKKKR